MRTETPSGSLTSIVLHHSGLGMITTNDVNVLWGLSGRTLCLVKKIVLIVLRNFWVQKGLLVYIFSTS